VTQINLPNRNITGDNLWSQVEDNDNAIANVVNGSLDNGNIAAGADINASKILDGSITAAKLGGDSVTSAKIANLAVLAGKIDIRTFQTTGSANNGTGVQTLASQASVPPGTYLAIGSYWLSPFSGTGLGRLDSISFAASAGAATFQQTNYGGTPIQPNADDTEPLNHFALISVTSTATIAFQADKQSTLGLRGSLLIIGIAS
jgi:hypothetical protein